MKVFLDYFNHDDKGVENNNKDKHNFLTLLLKNHDPIIDNFGWTDQNGVNQLWKEQINLLQQDAFIIRTKEEDPKLCLFYEVVGKNVKLWSKNTSYHILSKTYML